MRRKSITINVSNLMEIALTIFSIVFGAICFTKGDKYGLLQAALILGLVIILRLLCRIWRRLEDSGLRVWIVFFIIMTKVLGSSLGFYTLVPYWDKLEHFISGFLVVSVGSILYDRLSQEKSVKFNKSLKGWFLFFFAGAAALWWEVFEFSMDNWFGMHCQGGLSDTMWDGIMGTLGGGMMVIYMFIRRE